MENSNFLLLDLNTVSSLFSLFSPEDNLSSWIFKKGEDLDVLSFRQLRSFFEAYDSFPFFDGFSSSELIEILGFERGVSISLEQHIPLEESQKRRKKKEEQFKRYHFLFSSYPFLLSLQELSLSSPLSYCIFPHELGKQRLVFAFFLEKGDEYERVLDLLQKDNQLSSFLKTLRSLKKEELEGLKGFAFGFRFSEEGLERLTLYLSFRDSLSLELKKQVLESFFAIKNFPLLKNLTFYARDFFEEGSYEEKYYDTQFSFEETLSEKRLSFLKGKNCTKVYRFKDEVCYEEKYEFQLALFSKKELVSLSAFFSFRKEDSILALSLNEGTIVKVVSYSL